MNTQSSHASPTAEPTPDPDLDPDGISLQVEVSNTQSHLRVDPGALALLARDALRALDVNQAQLSIAVVDDANIQEINRRHLNHDWATDVITFPLSAPDDPILVGEIVVSAEMAVNTAREAGVDPWDELALYVVHGLLHLEGLDDHNDSERVAMRRREGDILTRLGLSNTFSAVADPDADTDQSAAGQRERTRCTF